MCHLGIFGKESQIYYCPIWNEQAGICVFAKFKQKTKTPKFGNFRLEFESNIVKFEISTVGLFLIAKYRVKTKMPKFGIRNASILYFWTTISKQYRNIWNQLPRIYLKGEFGGKTKTQKFGTKNALFAYFLPNVPYLCIFEEEY